MEPGRFARYPWWRRWFGRRSERAAAAYLRKSGFRILAANLDDRLGEIDLLALEGETLVVIEVRSTESDDLLRVMQTVDHVKQKKLTDAVGRYLSRKRLLGKIAVRFDVIALSWPPTAKTPTLEHVREAFPAVGRFRMFQ